MNQLSTSILLFLPLISALVILAIPREQAKLIKIASIALTSAIFVYSLFYYALYDFSAGGFQLVEKYLWISDLNISYHVGVDGLSILLILLTTFITPLALLGSYSGITDKVKEFNFFILVLQTGMIGVFVSLDLFLFYIFWEAMLIPMYFIIGIWGGQRRIYASVKFFIYTMAGSLLMLVAIIWLAFYAQGTLGKFTTDLLELYAIGPNVQTDIQNYLFLAFAISFAIKVPLFPLHTWLPDAHTEAPTAGSVILAGVLLKMGTYGLIRFNLPLFPQASIHFAPYISALAVIGIIYGALVAMVQKDMKKLVAYSSVSHLGFVVLGIFAFTQEAMQGAIIQMVNHGLSTGALFFLVGFVYERTHTRMIADYGGIAKVVPVFATIFMITSFSSIGVPGLNGFVGEFLILLGTFKSPILYNWWFAILAASGVIFSAIYMLWLYQRVFFGEYKEKESLHHLTDLNTRELVVLLPLLVFIVVIGIYPTPFLNMTDGVAANIIATVMNSLK